jgi:hypothetical protein
VATPEQAEWLRTGTDDAAWHGNGAVNGSARASSAHLVTTSGVETRTDHELSVAETPANRLHLVRPMPDAPAAPRLSIGGDAHEFLYVSDAAPDLAHLSPSVWHTLGAYIGPAISLAGLSYLAGALDTLRSLGRP